ncbi:MAG TPA: SCP2 sterol-binding domain-containing protein [Burkholderiales bacterium]|nr:SCP2 sterol-binding domain-containing protein [Burkholderiales bacterium]
MLPAPLIALARCLPERPPATLLAVALNVALGSGLLSRAALEPLGGRVVRLEVSDAGAGVSLTLGARGFRAADGHADVTIRAALRDFLSLALRREDPDTLFFTRRLVIEGDTELGLVAKNALDAVDWGRLALPLRPRG